MATIVFTSDKFIKKKVKKSILKSPNILYNVYIPVCNLLFET